MSVVITVNKTQVIKDLEELIKQFLETLGLSNIYVSENAPEDPAEGTFWYKPSENRLYVYVA